MSADGTRASPGDDLRSRSQRRVQILFAFLLTPAFSSRFASVTQFRRGGRAGRQASR